jgi:hypothetical protein
MNFSDFDICKELGIEKWGDVTGSQFNEFLVCSLCSSVAPLTTMCRFVMRRIMISLSDADSIQMWYLLRGTALAGNYSFDQEAR